MAETLIGDSVICEAYKTIEVHSDVVPKEVNFEIVREYPHRDDAYTQGLGLV